MKFILFLAILSSVLISCSRNNPSNKKELTDSIIRNVDESLLLINFLEKSGDFINSSKAPAIIQAQEVFENLSKYLIIDIRAHNDYVEGHIDGAIHVTLEKLYDFCLNEVNIASFEKIVIVCYSGQSASYATSLLRLAGAGNVFAMKWGMSAWKREYALNTLIKNISSSYITQLDTNNVQKTAKNNNYQFPKISTGKKFGYQILEERIKLIFKEGFKHVVVKFDTLVKNASTYFIINYWTKDEYKFGHFKNAYQFTPHESLNSKNELTLLPVDKPILIYCFTGHTSAQVAAYLRILGYDAHSLAYGTNSFMHSKMTATPKINKAFIPEKDINDYPVIKGENPSNFTVVNSSAETKQQPNKTTINKDKPKKKKEGGGC